MKTTRKRGGNRLKRKPGVQYVWVVVIEIKRKRAKCSR